MEPRFLFCIHDGRTIFPRLRLRSALLVGAWVVGVPLNSSYKTIHCQCKSLLHHDGPFRHLLSCFNDCLSVRPRSVAPVYTFPPSLRSCVFRFIRAKRKLLVVSPILSLVSLLAMRRELKSASLLFPSAERMFNASVTAMYSPTT
jgi:hypothetical protein